MVGVGVPSFCSVLLFFSPWGAFGLGGGAAVWASFGSPSVDSRSVCLLVLVGRVFGVLTRPLFPVVGVSFVPRGVCGGGVLGCWVGGGVGRHIGGGFSLFCLPLWTTHY